MKIFENHRRRYTKEDREYIEEKIGVISIYAIAKKLGRTPDGIESYCQKNGLGGFVYTGEYLTTGEVADIVGVDSTTVRNWIISFGLKAKKKRLKNRPIYRIDMKDLVEFLEAHQNLFNGMNIDEFALGEEPMWLKEKRIKDNNAMFQKSHSKWTTKEEKHLIELFQQGLTVREISEKVNRSIISVRKKRVLFIKSGANIEPAPTWSDFQKQYVKKNWSTMPTKAISETIGKPVHLIERYAYENKLGDRYSLPDGYYTFIEIANMLGVTRSLVSTWNKRKGLLAVEQNKGNKKRFVVHIKDLETFLQSDERYSKLLPLLQAAI